MSLNPCRGFVHEFLSPQYDLERVALPEGRHYKLPSGKLVPSVTTILSKLNSKKLDDWRDRVGEDEANKISTQAKLRGTAVHELCEKYLMNETNIHKGAMPFNYSEFKKIRPLLDKNVGIIYGVEYRLFSEEMEAAGTSDLICKWNGQNAIVDFKTSKYEKKEKDISHYFIQAACYALMVEELYGIEVPRIVIIMTVDHEDPIVFEKEKSDYVHQVRMIFGQR